MDSAAGRKTSISTNGKYRYGYTFVACLTLLLFRGWDRITHPELFAEGVRFMGSAFNHGWPGLLQSYDHYLHLAPNLIAVLAIKLVPMAHIPLFTNSVCYIISAAVMASVSRGCYRWLVPSDHARSALAILIVCAPGLMEILGNLAGIHWLLLFWLAVLCLKDPEQEFTVWELALVIVVVLSDGTSVIFLPLVFLRLFLSWQKPASKSQRGTAWTLNGRNGETALFLILFISAITIVINLLFQSGSNDDGSLIRVVDGIGRLLFHLQSILLVFYFLHPFFGTQNSSFIMHHNLEIMFPVAFIVMALLLWRLQRQLDHRFWLILTWLLCLFLLPLILSLLRYWAFFGLFAPPFKNWWFRYNFIFAATGLVFMFIMLRPSQPFRLNPIANLAIVILIVAYLSQANTMNTLSKPPHEKDRFAINRYGEALWSRTASNLERSIRTGCPGEVIVAGHPFRENADPPLWHFVYKSKHLADNCDSR